MKSKILSAILGQIAVLCIVTVCSAVAKHKITIENADIVGAGATFPAPLYQKWIQEFTKKDTSFTVFYDAVGSGAGTRRFIAEEVDFGASDSAMNDVQIEKVKHGVQLIPATAGIIVLAYNLPDVKGDLRLSRKVYTDIFLGKIRYWNDPRIKELNPTLDIPRLNIVTVTRSDSSGTTWAFTNHLNAVSDEWQSKGPGVGKKVDWPGTSMAARYNEGVAVKVRHSWGTIGYIEYGTAKRAGLKMAVLENKEGNFITPSEASSTSALDNTAAMLPPNLRMFIPDPDGDDSYPIITYSWLLLYQKYPDKKKAEKVKDFVHWGLTKGQDYSASFGYAQLPESVLAAAKSALENVH